MTPDRTRLLICVGLIFAMVVIAAGAADAGLFGLLKSKKHAAPTAQTSVVVFPFDTATSTTVPEGFGENVASYLRGMLAESNQYMAFLFRDRLAPIQRAKDDTTLKTQDLTAPFAEDKEKALKLAQILACDVYLVGAIEDYQFDPAKKAATLTLSAEMYDGKSGRLLGQYLVTGSADESSKAGTEDEYMAVAAGKAVDALKERILPQQQPEAAPADTAKPAGDSAPAVADAKSEAAPAPPAD